MNHQSIFGLQKTNQTLHVRAHTVREDTRNDLLKVAKFVAIKLHPGCMDIMKRAVAKVLDLIQNIIQRLEDTPRTALEKQELFSAMESSRGTKTKSPSAKLGSFPFKVLSHLRRRLACKTSCSATCKYATLSQRAGTLRVRSGAKICGCHRKGFRRAVKRQKACQRVYFGEGLS